MAGPPLPSSSSASSQPAPPRHFVVGIAGGTGSGKTTIAAHLASALPPEATICIEHDWYYRDRSGMPAEERALINFDHPDAIETEMLVAHLDALRAGQTVQAPQYDFRGHVRCAEWLTVVPAPIIIVEGILVLADERLRARLDLKIFVDTDADIRLVRRVARDLEERGRTFAQVRDQYFRTVRPMHLEFVEPSKRYADLIVPEGGENRAALDVLIGGLRRTIG
jgi:uridine kinase